MSLSKAEIVDWRKQETTIKILELLQDEIDVSLAEVVSGRVIRESSDDTAQSVSRMVGRVEGLSFLLNIEDEVDAE